MPKVLLTGIDLGGSGFLASHILDILLDHGFEVVATVRSEEKGHQIVDACSESFRGKLSYVIVSDIAQEGAFDNAVRSSPPFQFVIHTASPYHFNIVDPVKDLLDPAIKGTVNLLTAIYKYAPTVERVVLTSSSATILNPKAHAAVYDETIFGTTSWTEALNPPTAYRASKIYAERAAYAFLNAHHPPPRFTLTTINPPLLFGPPPRHLRSLSSLNTSNQRIHTLLNSSTTTTTTPGSSSTIPPTGPVYLFCDVRDAALAHVRALNQPPAQGPPQDTSDIRNERIFVVGGYFSNKRIADILREKWPEAEVPDGEDDFPAQHYGFDNGKSKDVLGIEYRDLRTCVEDAGNAILELAGKVGVEGKVDVDGVNGLKRDSGV